MRSVVFASEDWQKDSWIDYEMLTLEAETPEPEVKTKSVEVEGGDGALDMSEAVSGRPVFANRELVFPFRIVGEDCEKIRDEVVRDLHGRKRFVQFESQEHWFYGRCSVETTLDKGYYIEISVTVNAEPYKRNITPYRAENNVINGTTWTLYNEGDSHVLPTVELSKAMDIIVENVTYELRSGKQVAPFLIAPKGSKTVIFTDSASVVIEFWEGYIV